MRKRINTQGVVNRVKRLKAFRVAQNVYGRFWGVDSTSLTVRSLPGPAKKVKILVGLGRCPALEIADGPKGRSSIIRRRGLTGRMLACDAKGKRLFVIRTGKRRVRSGKSKRFLGWASAVEYVPTRSIEKAGSFKSNRIWRHLFSDDHGKWPKAFEGGDGTIALVGGTYKIGKWLRR
jgi:hypothetical protein